MLQAVPDKRIRTGGRLLTAAFLCWIVNGVILLGAFVVAAISTSDTLQTNPRLTIISAVRSSANPAFPAIPAVVALVAAGALFTVGLWNLRLGSVARELTDTGARDVYSLPAPTRRKALVAAILTLVYTAAGGIAFVGFAFTASEDGGDASTTWLLAWLGASVVLTAGAIMFSAFGRSFYADTGGLLLIRGSLFTDYAIANLVGLTFFVIAVLASTDVARLMEVLGVFSQLLVLPLTGIIVFGGLLFDSLGLRKTRSLARPVHVPGVASFGSPGTTAVSVGMEDVEVLRLQSRIDLLERAVKLQQESISQLRFLVGTKAENVPSGPGAVPGEPPEGPAPPTERGRPRPQSGERST